MCCAQFFIVEAIAAHAWTPPYSYARNYISDLGAVHCAAFPPGSPMLVCSPLHVLMNASFVVQGLLIAGGALLVRGMLARDRLTTVGLSLVALAGAGVLVVGLAPEDAHIAVHLLGASAHLVAGNVGLIVVGFTLFKVSRGWLGRVWIAAGLIGLIGAQLLINHTFLGLGVGGMERVGIYPLPLCLAVTGALWLVESLLRSKATA